MKDRWARHSRKITATRRWQALRFDILERCGWTCQGCGKPGRLEVDHIQPVRLAPQLAYDPANLQALCPACHTRKTRIECGHPPPREDRQQWQSAVAQLERRGKTPIKLLGENDA